MEITITGFTDYPEFESRSQKEGFQQDMIDKGFKIEDISTPDEDGAFYPEMTFNFITKVITFVDQDI